MARRRRAVGGMAAALGSLLVLGTAPGLSPLLWVAVGLAVLLGAYLSMLVYLRNTVSEREIRSAEPLACDWSSSPFLIDRWAITRFLWAGIAGGLLQLLGAVTQRMVDRRLIGDGSGQAWLGRSLRLQEQLRRQSVRVLFVSATAAAGASAVGSMGNVAAASTISLATPMPAPAGSSDGPLALTYTVAKGDTLTDVANRFATTAGVLATLNHLADPNLILVGQVIRLPGTVGAGTSLAAPPPTTSADSTYTVVAGDTVAKIASRFATTVPVLTELNHLADPNVILVGETLAVSGAVSGAAAPAATPVTTGPVTTGPAVPAAPAAGPPPATASGTSVSGAAGAVRVALAQVGKPYTWAGAGPDNFDCSGLVMYAWQAAGVSLPHYSVSQYDDTARISAGQLRPGDLVFYGGGGAGEPQHVDLYIGGGQVVAADNYGTDVRVESIGFAGTPSAYGRVG